MNRLTAKVAEMGIYARFASSDEFDIIQKLGEYEDLEEAGRLVKLPCKAGDTVYYISDSYKRGRTIIPSEVHEAVVDHFTIGDYGKPVMTVCDNENVWTDFLDDDIETAVFLTREEAEAGRQGEQAAKPPTSPALEGAEQ